MPAVVPGRRQRGPRTGSDDGERAPGDGEPGHVPGAVQQPKGHAGAGHRGGRVRHTASGRHQLYNGLLGAHIAGQCTAVEQTRVGNAVRHHVGSGQFRSCRTGGQGGSETAVVHLRSGFGRGHAHVRPVLLLLPK